MKHPILFVTLCLSLPACDPQASAASLGSTKVKEPPPVEVKYAMPEKPPQAAVVTTQPADVSAKAIAPKAPAGLQPPDVKPPSACFQGGCSAPQDPALPQGKAKLPGGEAEFRPIWNPPGGTGDTLPSAAHEPLVPPPNVQQAPVQCDPPPL